MDNLSKSRAYLSGPIEYGDLGCNWRTEPSSILKNEFGINLFDPFADPKQQWVPILSDAKEKKDFEQIRSITKSFVRKDLAMVDRSDFLIAYLPFKIPTTGTHHEIINSSNAKKPTLLVTDKEDITYLPLWYFGFIPTECMFAGWDNLYRYLRSVNRGEQTHNNRWDFICGLV